MGWSLEFGGGPAVFLAFCGAACRSGRESIACARAIGSSASSRLLPTRDPQLRPRDFQAWASCTNRQTTRPQNQNRIGTISRLPIGDPSPISRRCTPTAPRLTDNFPFVLNTTRKQSPMVPWPRSEQAPHLGHPSPQSHDGSPSRAAPHACTTGPVRPGRKPSPAVPVPRHGQKRGPLRCVDQVPRAG